MNLNDLIPRHVDFDGLLIMRHTPQRPRLRQEMLKLAIEEPKVFNEYQQTQRPREEKMLAKAKYLVALFGNKPGEAVFVGLYRNRGSRQITRRELLGRAATRELGKYGVVHSDRPSRLLFDLREEGELRELKCKFVVRWGTEKAWARWASKNEFPIISWLDQAVIADPAPAEDDEQGNPLIEDLTIIREHKRFERDPLISAKVKRALGYQCQACGLRFEEMYPGIQDARYIEAHHLIPAWKMKGRRIVHKNPKRNFAVLCANCHRMIHRFERPGNLVAFRRTIRSR